QPLMCLFSLQHSRPLPTLHSFPTRRSSDLGRPRSFHASNTRDPVGDTGAHRHAAPLFVRDAPGRKGAVVYVRKAAERTMRRASGDRKSTRLNSSHQIISYAVFCLKKKKSKK